MSVLVVGAGFSGLRAATLLHETGLSVVVLEAGDRVGGRTHTAEHKGSSIDLGGQWIGPAQSRVCKLAKALSVRLKEQYDDGTTLMVNKGIRAELHDIPPPVLALFGQCFQLPLEAPWESPNAIVWDQMLVSDWIKGSLLSEEHQAIATTIVRNYLATEPDRISVFEALRYINACEGVNIMTGTKGMAEEHTIDGGAQNFAQKLAALLPPESLRLNSQVVSVEQLGGQVRVRCENNLTFSADYVIFALAPPLLDAIQFTPILPPGRGILHSRSFTGSVVKAHFFYDRPFWRDQGLSGSAWTASSGPVASTADGTYPDSPVARLVAFVVGVDSEQLSKVKREEDRRAALIPSMVALFGPEAAKTASYRDFDWNSERNSKGCFGSLCPPGVATVVGAALRQPVGRLHWAGSETAFLWSGYMDGAIESGERAAAEIVAAVQRRGPLPPGWRAAGAAVVLETWEENRRLLKEMEAKRVGQQTARL
eukprot:CAMPEP_0114558214 /NCGR_PEP_ID=MMETSP0114-20121206/10252_1 /TAXON_ID=31324 /ORGANISM="Goniomonas sp, Strain m" /LENGTH=480 /DNA_ID=CAMNT_0001743569 /DNA_START=16 /DNA_END=1458 /DNA_ORIENTATION=-